MVGEFKDDALQSHKHIVSSGASNTSSTVYGLTHIVSSTYIASGGVYDARYSVVTRGKRKGVKIIIKVL